MSTSPPPNVLPLITRYPGECIVFNLHKCSRVKKNQSNTKEGEDPVFSEIWTNEDYDNFLIVRLIRHTTNPWMVAHHGIFEILRAPLVLPAIDLKGNDRTLCIRLRDYSNRGQDDCIKRSFHLTFSSSYEAEIFKHAHNKLLKLKAAVSSTHCHSDYEKLRPTKKRRISQISTNSAEDKGKDDEDKEKEATAHDVLKTENNENCLKANQEFEVGNDHDFLDDCFEETQNPFDNL